MTAHRNRGKEAARAGRHAHPPDGRTAPGSMLLPSALWRKRFRARLVRWYQRHARDLPWRRTKDPYRVWLSEIMLQQTTVGTVRAYFERFVDRFPTIACLAEAREEDVLRQWEGLGYYRRARQLHQAARLVLREHGGVFPREFEHVERLPGIGRYTAGAILSIAFDARLPILEANTRRLFSRLMALEGEADSAAAHRVLWGLAEAVLPTRNVGTFNQALMELGSQVCTVRRPRCAQCPVASLCEANARGLQTAIPRPRRKRPPEPRHEVAVIICRGGRVLLVRRPDRGRWAGLWDFPRFTVAPGDPEQLWAQLGPQVQQQTGVRVRPGPLLATLRHAVTRYRITLDCYAATYVGGAVPSHDDAGPRWLLPEELDAYPLSTTGRKLSRLAAEVMAGPIARRSPPRDPAGP